MNAEIEKLIASVKETGSMTARQKEIILTKAKQLGDDIDEVEFILEDIPIRDSSRDEEQNVEGRNKCPNCGAILSGTLFACPECGYILQKENKSSKDVRKYIDELQDSLSKAALPVSKHEKLWNGDRPSISRQANVVNSFTLPVTKEGLLQLLEFSYSNFISIGTSVQDMDMKPLKDAWYGKCKQALNALSRIGSEDPEVQTIVGRYQALIISEKKKIGGSAKLWLLIAVAVAALVGIVRSGIRSDNSAFEEVQNYVENHDFASAKIAAQKYSGDIEEILDNISCSEVEYLISVGDFRQASIVASSINDQMKKESMIEAINNAKE